MLAERPENLAGADERVAARNVGDLVVNQDRDEARRIASFR